MKLLDQKGIINVGGKSQTIFNFVKIEKEDILPKKYDFKNQLNPIPKNSSLNLSKLKKLLKKNIKK
jgi:dTDP-4-dehydrorhamnose reductase